LGCTAEENLVLERLSNENPDWGVELVSVQGMPLESTEVGYYYAMYAQTLAWLSRPKENFCSKAYPVLQVLRNSPYTSDEVLTIIMNESEAICRRIEGNISP
jgi:hypothetical protein